MSSPDIKTQTISEVVLTNSQLIELIRTHYGTDAVPMNAEVKGHYPHGSPLEGVKVTWRTPADGPPR